MYKRTYLCIDLKSFYASVECVERGLDPMTTNLVVADISRTEKTICLAVSPALKAYGISGRARLFEVIQRVKEVNRQRKNCAPRQKLLGASCDDAVLKTSPELALDYITAPPRMAHYMDFSTRIYNIYLKYIAPEDIHVYSIDEVFMDVTNYLSVFGISAREFAVRVIQDVLHTTGITATAGIGTNMYLAKVAMDILAKNVSPDENGVRIAELDELSYREKLWTHRPLTDFWRVGKGYAKKLESVGLYTMGDIAKCSVGKTGAYYSEDLLYKLFGVNAELLIDHAWGWEPCTIADVKAYQPQSKSIGSGQVLHCPYPFEKARLVVREMTELLALDLVDKKMLTNQLILTVGYDIENLTDSAISRQYQGAVTVDHYGRKIPKHAHGTANLEQFTSSGKQMIAAVTKLYDRIVNPRLLVRRISITANHVMPQEMVKGEASYTQIEMFVDDQKLQREEEQAAEELQKERNIQEAMLRIKKQFGKNAVLKGINLEEGATTITRNGQIGGHKA